MKVTWISPVMLLSDKCQDLPRELSNSIYDWCIEINFIVFILPWPQKLNHIRCTRLFHADEKVSLYCNCCYLFIFSAVKSLWIVVFFCTWSISGRQRRMSALVRCVWTAINGIVASWKRSCASTCLFVTIYSYFYNFIKFHLSEGISFTHLSHKITTQKFFMYPMMWILLGNMHNSDYHRQKHIQQYLFIHPIEESIFQHELYKLYRVLYHRQTELFFYLHIPI